MRYKSKNGTTARIANSHQEIHSLSDIFSPLGPEPASLSGVLPFVLLSVFFMGQLTAVEDAAAPFSEPMPSLAPFDLAFGAGEYDAPGVGVKLM